MRGARRPRWPPSGPPQAIRRPQRWLRAPPPLLGGGGVLDALVERVQQVLGYRLKASPCGALWEECDEIQAKLRAALNQYCVALAKILQDAQGGAVLDLGLQGGGQRALGRNTGSVIHVLVADMYGRVCTGRAEYELVNAVPVRAPIGGGARCLCNAGRSCGSSCQGRPRGRTWTCRARLYR